MSPTVMVNGCFDVLHVGHVQLLSWAAQFGDVHVAINSDDSVRRLKGDSRPWFSAQERRKILLALRHVANVVIFCEDTPGRVMAALNPDVVVVGCDHSLDDPHYAEARRVGRHVIQAPRFPSVRSSTIIERML